METRLTIVPVSLSRLQRAKTQLQGFTVQGGCWFDSVVEFPVDVEWTDERTGNGAMHVWADRAAMPRTHLVIRKWKWLPKKQFCMIFILKLWVSIFQVSSIQYMQSYMGKAYYYDVYFVIRDMEQHQITQHERLPHIELKALYTDSSIVSPRPMFITWYETTPVAHLERFNVTTPKKMNKHFHSFNRRK